MLGVGFAGTVIVPLTPVPSCTLAGDVAAGAGYWVEAVSEPDVTAAAQGTVRVPQYPGLGYNVLHELIDRWTVEKEIFRAS